MNSKFVRAILPVIALGAATALCNAIATHPLAEPVTTGEGENAPRFFASTGALRPILADAFWLRANLAWEAEDETSVRTWTRLAVAAEPEREYFRFNAARMTVFDFPHWRMRRERDVPLAVREKWRRELADEALAILAPQNDPASVARWLEAGNIALYGRGDLLGAAEYFRRAAECADAPWHAGRICAELLRQAGRPGEAVAWLRAWVSRLPPDEPEAQRELVAARLAELERELGRTEPF